MKQIVIYSHGFGVEKDDRGLFTDIAAGMPKTKHVLFDYNIIDGKAKTLTVAPIQDQVDKLKRMVSETKAQNPDAIIDIVGHSQGCLVAALAGMEGVRKAIFLAPPSKLDGGRLVKLFSERPGSNIDLDGISKLQRRDGTITIVPSKYWHSIKDLQPIVLYNHLANLTEVIIAEAHDDEVLGVSNFRGLDSEIEHVHLDGNHDFTSDARAGLVNFVKSKLG